MRGIRFSGTGFTGETRFIPAHAGNSTSIQCRGLSSSVHPRACGEFIARYKRSTALAGSSPRMRGIRRMGRRFAPKARFIPAHAGNSIPIGIRCLQGSGSSPRMRGILGGAVRPPAGDRFIPAHAGNSLASASSRRFLCGSSPRMRGIPAAPAAPGRRRRFIPAHAGNSSTMMCRSSRATVHPRACGEFLVDRSREIYPAGSSPRMRGILQRAMEFRPDNRFIPAHAGNSSPDASAAAIAAVHPRACGEFISRNTAARPRCWFIPAHAGNSSRRCCPRRSNPVHPRACGEFVAQVAGASGAHGSSPRMRGIHHCENQLC